MTHPQTVAELVSEMTVANIAKKMSKYLVISKILYDINLPKCKVQIYIVPVVVVFAAVVVVVPSAITKCKLRL